MRATARMALALPMVVALIQPASAQTTWVPIFNTERAYAHCGADKATVGEHATYTYNTTAPTTSYTANGGCGALDIALVDAEGITFTGKHTGNLKQLTVHAWMIDVGTVRAGVYSDWLIDVSVTIDGEQVVGGVETSLIPIPSSTGISRLAEFSVTGIKLLGEQDYKEHEVAVSLETHPYQDGDQIAWVLDATEIPSGITFSPTTLAGSRVPVDG